MYAPYIGLTIGLLGIAASVCAYNFRAQVARAVAESPSLTHRKEAYIIVLRGVFIGLGVSVAVVFVSAWVAVAKNVYQVPAGYVVIIGEPGDGTDVRFFTPGQLVTKKPWQPEHRIAVTSWSGEKSVSFDRKFSISATHATVKYTVRRIDPEPQPDWIAILTTRGDHPHEDEAVQNVLGEVALKIIAEVPASSSARTYQDALNSRLFDEAKPRLLAAKFELIAAKCSKIE